MMVGSLKNKVVNSTDFADQHLGEHKFEKHSTYKTLV